MVIKELFKAPLKKQEETVEFFHVGNDIQFMKSFLQEGAKAIGRGVGGQKTGFYLWTNRKKAEEHILFKDTLGFYYGSILTMREQSDFSNEGGVMIGVRVPKRTIVYPQWQIDYEFNSKYLMDIFDQYADEITRLKNFSFVKSDQKYICTAIKKNTSVPHEFIYQRADGQVEHFNLKDMGIETTGILQAICDKMCLETPKFLKAYNQALQKSLSDKEGQAIKYTDQKPLVPSYVSWIQGNQTGSFKESVLYTDKKTASQQVCPFLLFQLKRHKRNK